MTTATANRRIAQLDATDALLAIEQATYNERAAQAETPGQYDKFSRLANDLEGVRMRMAEKRARLQAAAR